MKERIEKTIRTLREKELAGSNGKSKKGGAGMIEKRYKTGRCANGAEKDRGQIFHLVDSETGIALCGTRPGRLSGWADVAETEIGDGRSVCSRCYRKYSTKAVQG